MAALKGHVNVIDVVASMGGDFSIKDYVGGRGCMKLTAFAKFLFLKPRWDVLRFIVLLRVDHFRVLKQW